MPGIFSGLAIAYSTFSVLLVIRWLWMKAQVKRAVRTNMVPASATELKVSTEHPFVGCGSIKAALWSSLCNRDFRVNYRDSDGTVRNISVTAVFHPIIGHLQRVEMLPPASLVAGEA